MSTLGIIGALAQGYTDAAAERRRQNLSLGEHQRDLQIGLLDKLIADPSTPAEYKDTLLQQRIATTNANQYDKNGMLKLPSLDDTMRQLPPIQRTTPGSIQAPAIQLPSAPPDVGFRTRPDTTGDTAAYAPRPTSAVPLGGATMPSGASGGAGAALPPSGIQKPSGAPSVPPMLQMPTAPPTLPATPVAIPATGAGQFHAMTPQEQVQHDIAIRKSHADALIEQGVSPQQAYVAAGLSIKPELHNIPWGGKAINPYTGQEFSGGVKPIGQPIKMVDDAGNWKLFQRMSDGSMQPVEQDGMVIPPPPSFTPTQRTSTTSDEFGVKSTTTSQTQKIVPGTKGAGAAKTTITKPSAPPTSGGQADTRTPAEKRADFKNQKALELAQAKIGSIPTTATRNMAEKAPSVQHFADNLLAMMDAKDANGAPVLDLGPGASRWQEFWTGKVGTSNPAFTTFRTNAELLATALANMHVGQRGAEQTVKRFENLIAWGKQSPDNMRAALKVIKDYAIVKQHEAMPKPVNLNAPSGSAKTPEDEANEYLQSLGKGGPK